MSSSQQKTETSKDAGTDIGELSPATRRVFGFFGLLTLAFGCLIAWYTYGAFTSWLRPTPASTFEKLWNEDLARLAGQKLLPKAWASIGELEITASNPETEIWKAQVHPLLPRVPGGKYKLEVFIDSWADEEEGLSGALVEYHLIEIASGNTVWERGRTFVWRPL